MIVTILIAFTLCGLLLVSEPEARLWLTDEEQKFAWCGQYQPRLNLSSNFGYDSRISEWCYGKLWEDYCKISYPDDCPTKTKGDK